MKKKQRRLTKRQRKELEGRGGSGQPARTGGHIHCIACGRHIDPAELRGALATATFLTCNHGGRFACCLRCSSRARELVEAHDRGGQPVQAAPVWH